MCRFKEIREALHFEYHRKGYLDDRIMRYSMGLNWEWGIEGYNNYARRFL